MGRMVNPSERLCSAKGLGAVLMISDVFMIEIREELDSHSSSMFGGSSP